MSDASNDSSKSIAETSTAPEVSVKHPDTVIISRCEGAQNSFNATCFCGAGDDGTVNHQDMVSALYKLKKATRLALSKAGSCPGKALHRHQTAVFYFPVTDTHVRFALQSDSKPDTLEKQHIAATLVVNKVMLFLEEMIRFANFASQVEYILRLSGVEQYDAVRRLDFGRFERLRNESGMWHRGVLRLYPTDQVEYLVKQIEELQKLKNVSIESFQFVESKTSDTQVDIPVLGEALTAVMDDPALDPSVVPAKEKTAPDLVRLLMDAGLMDLSPEEIMHRIAEAKATALVG